MRKASKFIVPLLAFGLLSLWAFAQETILPRPTGGGASSSTNGLATTNYVDIALTNANTVHLSKAGNDSTAIRGNSSKPFLTPTNAIAALRSGDTLLIWPGDYQVLAGGSPQLASLASSNGAALNLYNLTNVSVIGMGQPRLIYSNSITVMQVQNVSGLNISGLTFECTNKFGGSSISNLIACINVDGTSRDGRISDCNFINYPDHGIADALFTTDQTQTNFWISRCRFFNGGATSGVPSLVADGAAVVPSAYWSITDCIFDSCYRGIEIFRGDTAVIPFEQIRISGNAFHFMHGESIVIPRSLGDDLVKDVIITGNTFDDNSGQINQSQLCISGAGGCSRINIINNVFDFSLNFFQYYDAIDFKSGAGQGKIKDCQFIGNTILSPGGPAIYLSDNGSSATATNNVIANNIIRRPVGGGITVAGAGNRILNNSIESQFSGNGSVYLLNFANGTTRNNQVIGNHAGSANNAGVYMDLGASNNFVCNNFIIRPGVQSVMDLNVLGHNTIFDNLFNGTRFQNTNELGTMATTVNGQGGFATLKATGEVDIGGPAIVTNIVQANNLVITNNGSLAFATNLTAADTFLVRDNAPNVLAMRNGANMQTFKVYGTYTDSGNYERVYIGNGSASSYYKIGTEGAGSGAARQLIFSQGAVDFLTLGGTAGKWNLSSVTGHLLAGADNAIDVGASGASRPRSIYAGTSIVAPQLQATKTANYTVSANEPGTFFNNNGTAGVTTNTLPASVAGMQFNFAIVTAKTNSIVASGTDTIRNAATVSAAGGMIYSSTIGSTVHLFCPVAGQWFTDSINGTWVVQ